MIEWENNTYCQNHAGYYVGQLFDAELFVFVLVLFLAVFGRPLPVISLFLQVQFSILS